MILVDSLVSQHRPLSHTALRGVRPSLAICLFILLLHRPENFEHTPVYDPAKEGWNMQKTTFTLNEHRGAEPSPTSETKEVQQAMHRLSQQHAVGTPLPGQVAAPRKCRVLKRMASNDSLTSATSVDRIAAVAADSLSKAT